MRSADVRQQFIQFFKDRGHTYVHSSPSIAVSDPTLMFTNAGMNQFKDIFLGVEKRSYTRAVNSQKCIRVSGKHNDLEEVGRDGSHHTFFEMLGNWSFGDYYKREAIGWSWELLTSIWKLPKDRLYATIFQDDDEADKIWREVTDIAPDRIRRFGAKQNFWEMGDTGPCGPCTEIHFDRGTKYGCGPACTVNCDCGRFLELWNNVFIQSNRGTDGKLTPLVHKHVDTGMGLERITAVLGGKAENYDTDLFQPLFARIAELTGRTLDAETRTPFRVIADHIRMLTFAVTDGAVPSNEGRGYVVRRVLRRGVRFANLLAEGTPVLSGLVDTVVDTMGGFFTELKQNPGYVRDVIRSEEEKFQRTLRQGNELFVRVAADLPPGGTVRGTDVFTLYDTYGFPPDLVNLMANEKGLKVDMAGFEAEMERQKERSRAGVTAKDVLPADLSLPPTVFRGYDHMRLDGRVLAAGPEFIVTDTTPFYAESGGQKGDAGTIRWGTHAFTVLTTVKARGMYAHVGRYQHCNPPGTGDLCTLEVDHDQRRNREANHTATHLLHHALREKFGTQVKQQGSMVDADRFSFDFTFSRKLTDIELVAIEDRVNALIRQDLPTRFYEIPLAEAKARGIIALFDEKYGEQVRVVDVGDGLSRELCGGTHAGQTGIIKYFALLSEEAISAGNRRITGCTGRQVEERLDARKTTINAIRQALSGVGIEARVEGLGGTEVVTVLRTAETTLRGLMAATDSQENTLEKKIDALAAENRDLRGKLGKPAAKLHGELVEVVAALAAENKAFGKELARAGREQAGAAAEQAGAVMVKGISVTSLYAAGADPKALNDIILGLQARNPEGLCLVAGDLEGKTTILCAAGPAALAAGYKAGAVIKAVGKAAGGGGGGKDTFARGGGGDPAKTRAAIEAPAGLLG